MDWSWFCKVWISLKTADNRHLGIQQEGELMARKKRSSIDVRDGFHVVVMDDIEIWDGADLALLRETLSRLVDQQKQKAVGVEMTWVKYIPSGFFGMLYDYCERGVAVRLYSPQPHVQKMLWFREFFEADGADHVFSLRLRTRTASVEAAAAAAATRAPWLDDAPTMPSMLSAELAAS